MCIHNVRKRQINPQESRYQPVAILDETEPPLWFRVTMIGIIVAAVALTVYGFIAIVQ